MLTLILLFLNRSFKALSDKIKSSFNDSILSNIKNDLIRDWCDPSKSWYLKWKIVDGKQVLQTKKLWYYLWIFTPKYVERFPFSSTWLVKYTDLWHTSEFIRRTSIAIIILSYSIGMYLFISTGYIYRAIMLPDLLGSLVTALHDQLGYYVLNCIILITGAQLIGFTLFYDYILNKKK